jgi:hypothetical protein
LGFFMSRPLETAYVLPLATKETPDERQPPPGGCLARGRFRRCTAPLAPVIALADGADCAEFPEGFQPP